MLTLIAEALTKEYRSGDGALAVLKDVSVGIRQGEFVAIVGPSGSGKTTLLGLLAGLDTPTRGRVILDGDDLSVLSEDERALVRGEKVGFVFQSFQLIPTLTAGENVQVPLELRSGRVRGGAASHRGGGGYGSATPLAPPSSAAHRLAPPSPAVRARELLVRVGLGERVGHFPSQLSGGEQQRVAIARAFVNQPAILFADEPTGNLDAGSGAKVLELMEVLNRESGSTVVLVTHDEQLARRAGRRIRLLDGRGVEDTGA